MARLRYRLQTNVQTYNLYPRIPSEPGPGFTQEHINGLHRSVERAASTLLERLQSDDPTAEFVKWWVEDEAGEAVHESDTLTTLVPAVV